MTDPTPLNPATQAVLDAYADANWGAELKNSERRGLAAALRAAADLINGVPDDPGLMSNAFWAGRASAATKLLSIAAELGGTQPPSENV